LKIGEGADYAVDSQFSIFNSQFCFKDITNN